MIEATVTWRKGGSMTVCAETWEELFRQLGDGDYISLVGRVTRKEQGNE